MNLKEIVDSLLFFVAKWSGVTLPRVVAAFVGLTICARVIAVLWERRKHYLAATAVFAAGLLLILFALDPRILHALVATTLLTRIRLLMGVLSAAVVIVTFESIRRSHLQERYAILWVTTGVIILLCAFFPGVLFVFSSLLGMQYVTAVVAVVFTFLVLVAFHFSIAMSGFHESQSRIAQRCAILESRVNELADELARLKNGSAGKVAPPREAPCEPKSEEKTARMRGSLIAAPLVMAIAFVAVLLTGMLAPQAMIGDEVTHFYMLKQQAANLGQPNFYAPIPHGWEETEVRRYPHAFFWHYVSALAYRFSGSSFAAVQALQGLFLVQLLLVAFLLARSRGGVETRSSLLYVIVLATIPMSLIFSVAFYQDVPVTAQVLTAFYLLKKRRWVWASLFIAFAMGIKESAILFLPPFFLLMWIWQRRAEKDVCAGGTSVIPLRLRNGSAMILSGLIIYCSMWGTAYALQNYVETTYYPLVQWQKMVKRLTNPAPEKAAATTAPAPTAEAKAGSVTPYEAVIIANHPGDLRIPENYVVYGGGVMWLVLMMGVVGYLYQRKKTNNAPESPLWLYGTGLWYLGVSAVMIRSAPDARFFLPGLPFVLLPFVEQAVKLPRAKTWMAILIALAIMQSATVLGKTYRLREITPGIREAVRYLEENPPEPGVVFMYPEGNYRLFPVPHEWYLGYRLREFWRAGNDERIDMLREFYVGAIVIKKHLIAPVDDEITNLGVYPDYFVNDLAADARFTKVFENEAVIIYKMPRPSSRKK